MQKNKSGIIIGGIVVILLVVLFLWPRINSPTSALVKNWNDHNIDCIDEGQVRLLEHFHPTLSIIVDGKDEFIPTNGGIVPSWTAEIHTHDGTGTIHVESPSANKEFKLQDFFLVWGETLERPGFNLEMTVDGAKSTELGNLVLKDKQKIVLTYTKISG